MSLSGVFSVAAAATLLGWGASELRHRGFFPETVRLDGAFPAARYASTREMEQVCCTEEKSKPESSKTCNRTRKELSG